MRAWLRRTDGQLDPQSLAYMEYNYRRLQRHRRAIAGLGLKAKCYAGYLDHHRASLADELYTKRDKKKGLGVWLKNRLVGKEGCGCPKCTTPGKQARRKLMDEVRFGCLAILLSS